MRNKWLLNLFNQDPRFDWECKIFKETGEALLEEGQNISITTIPATSIDLDHVTTSEDEYSDTE